MTLCLASCAGTPKPRAIPVAVDRTQLAECPAEFPAPPALTPLAPFALPDGRQAVLLDTVIGRETATAHYILEGRGAWHECRSAVTYVEQWSALMAIPTKGRK